MINKVTRSKPITSLPSPTSEPSIGVSFPLTKHVSLGRIGQSATGDRFIEVRFKCSAGWRTRLLPVTGLTPSSSAFDVLTADGAWLVSPEARRELVRRIQLHRDDGIPFPVATRIGWHDTTFVLPLSKYGPDNGDLRAYLDHSRPERFSRYRVGGSLKGWAELAKLAEGNSRLVLLIAAAFSGPVAALFGLEQIGLMLVGPLRLAKPPP